MKYYVLRITSDARHRVVAIKNSQKDAIEALGCFHALATDLAPATEVGDEVVMTEHGWHLITEPSPLIDNVDETVDRIAKAVFDTAEVEEGEVVAVDTQAIKDAILSLDEGGIRYPGMNRRWMLLEQAQFTEALVAACEALENSVEIIDNALVATDQDAAIWAARVAFDEYVKRGGPKPKPDDSPSTKET